MVRHNALDAYFTDEAPLVPALVPNPRGVLWNRFTTVVPAIFGGDPTITVQTATLHLPNPLDPTVTPFGLVQPEVIPPASLGDLEAYRIYLSPSVIGQLIVGRQMKVTVVFCVWSELNRHGLRSFLFPKADRVIVTVSGHEADDVHHIKAWGTGITDAIIASLFAEAGFPTASFVVDTVAGYSTGYRGVNGTINNNLLNLSNLRRLVFLDALYRGDDPLPGQNTRRMLQKAQAANPGLEVIVYEVTPGGTPRDGAGNLVVALPANVRLINLKQEENGLLALILARIGDAGVLDGSLSPNQVPAPIRTLAASLPARGTLASSPLTAAGAANGTLVNWANANRATVTAAVNQSFQFVSLIRQLDLTGWTDFPDTGSLRHDGFMADFGWEFLA